MGAGFFVQSNRRHRRALNGRHAVRQCSPIRALNGRQPFANAHHRRDLNGRHPLVLNGLTQSARQCSPSPSTGSKMRPDQLTQQGAKAALFREAAHRMRCKNGYCNTIVLQLRFDA